jgi:hypothetical protein
MASGMTIRPLVNLIAVMLNQMINLILRQACAPLDGRLEYAARFEKCLYAYAGRLRCLQVYFCGRPSPNWLVSIYESEMKLILTWPLFLP